MKLFLGFAFRDADKDLVDYSDQLIAADAQFTRELREPLGAMGVEATSGDTVKAGVPVDYAIRQEIDASDAMVFVVSSGASSLWSKREMSYAVNRKHGKPVILVMLGSNAEIPEQLTSFAAVYANPSQTIDSVATEIAKVANEFKG